MQSYETAICPLLREAGRRILSACDVEHTGRVSEKGEDAANLVTAYDTAVQEYLVRELSALYPGARFLAEEQENDPAVLGAECCFVIDPIDGTANFVHGLRCSAISLSLLTHGEAVFAAVYDPYLDELFTAVRGGGAFLNGRRILVASRPPHRAMTVFGTSPYAKERYAAPTFRLAEALFRKTRDVRRSGSAALDLAHLAAGRIDVFFELTLSPWDIAAGILLIREAGGRITDLAGDPPGLGGTTSVLAASAACYDFLFAEATAILS